MERKKKDIKKNNNNNNKKDNSLAIKERRGVEFRKTSISEQDCIYSARISRLASKKARFTEGSLSFGRACW